MSISQSLEESADNAGQPRQTVVNCYVAADGFFLNSGVVDLTEGIYHGNRDLPDAIAQDNQRNYLLDQAKCTEGSRLLDIGCGYGTLLETALARKALATGITITPPQVEYNQKRGLDVRLMDYRDIPADWNGRFDCITANGSSEHFVGARDAAEGRAEEIWREMFAIAHRMIDPKSSSRRFVTTTINYVRPPRNPLDLLKKPSSFPRGSDEFKWSVLAHGWGGYYPEIGQYERCARGYFKLVEEVDGTQDYLWTSEHWGRQVKAAFFSRRILQHLSHIVKALWKAPRQTSLMVMSNLSSNAWTWQFRGPNAPTRLLRQTWEYIDPTEPD